MRGVPDDDVGFTGACSTSERTSAYIGATKTG
jgi:hypothetical protein